MPNNHTPQEIGQAIVANLTPDLLKPKWRRYAQGRHPLTGFCYVASEAFFHLMGGYNSDFRPFLVRHEKGADGDDAHYYVQNIVSGEIYDLTAAQFTTPVPYQNGKRRQFMTPHPSKRAAEVIRRVAATNKSLVASPNKRKKKKAA